MRQGTLDEKEVKELSSRLQEEKKLQVIETAEKLLKQQNFCPKVDEH